MMFLCCLWQDLNVQKEEEIPGMEMTLDPGLQKEAEEVLNMKIEILAEDLLVAEKEGILGVQEDVIKR